MKINLHFIPDSAAVILVSVFFLYSSEVVSKEWVFRPVINFSETYSDNSDLEYMDPKEEYTTELSPGFRIHGGGAKNEQSLEYNLRLISNTGDKPSSNKVHHQLKAESNSFLFQDELELRASLERTQVYFTQDGAVSIAFSDSKSSGLDDVNRMRINPIYTKRFDAGLRLRLDYRYLYTDYSQTTTEKEEFYTQVADFSLSDWHDSNTVNWALIYKNLDNSRDEEIPGAEEKMVALDVVTSRRTALLLDAGEAEVEFWHAGMRWVPSRRSRLELLYGEKHKEISRGFKFNIGNKRIKFSSDYSEEIVDEHINTFSTVATEDGQVSIPGPSPELRLFPVVTDAIFFSKRLSADIKYLGRKFGLGIKYVNSQLFVNTSENIIVGGQYSEQDVWTADFKFNINRRLELRTILNYEELSLLDLARDDVFEGGEFRVKHTVNSNLNMYYSYSKSRVDSSVEVNSFDENLATIKIEYFP